MIDKINAVYLLNFQLFLFYINQCLAILISPFHNILAVLTGLEPVFLPLEGNVLATRR